ncbi:GAF domain-containing protein [Marilutibacter alkalisoli]|nr:GAF domain-containing protein [Lysobacter alkalisoli]
MIPAVARLRIGRATAEATSGTAPPGTEAECLPLAHASISRLHAELRNVGGSWHLADLGSKNGSFVDGIRINEVRLPDSCWLRFGDVHCEFATVDDAHVEADASRFAARRARATAHTQQLGRINDLDSMLDATLRSVLELAQCDRGFVLLEEGSGYSVRASIELPPASLALREFSGSVGAVQRAMGERHAVVANDISTQPWLAGRASVSAAGLSTLVCLPLLDGDDVLGAVYADRVRPGAAISTLDVELLQAFVENAAVWIAARRAHDLLDAHTTPAEPPREHAWERIIANHAGQRR